MALPLEAPDNRVRDTAGDPKDISPSPSTQPCPEDTAAANSINPIGLLEEQDLAQAIQLSLQDQAKGQKETGTLMGLPHRQSSSCEPSLELVLSMNNEFTGIHAAFGDTAIYFGPPPQMPEQNDKDYQYIKQHFDRVHVVRCADLRLMGHESRFTERDLLNPTKSFRAERKLRKLGVLNKAEAAHGGKFKYYIDLRPPNEEDEAVLLITDLTCTRGVLTWHLARNKYDLSPHAVLGHDEFGAQPRGDTLTNPVTSLDNTKNADLSPSSTVKPTSESQSSNGESAPAVPNPQIAPEYTPLRHWSALERMLQAIQGNDPKLDSAPKVWTFFAIVRYFGCAAHERISGWIMTWLYAGNNSNFIQNNPEVAYRIAMGIRSADLIKDSFSILVGERALVEACGEVNPEILTLRRQSVHGRKLELLDDDERNRIDHAASAFVKRIREIVCNMCKDMDFLHRSEAYARLENAVGQTSRAVEALQSTKNTVKEYVRSRIYDVLCQAQGTLRGLESDLKSTLPFRLASSEDYSMVYSSLNQQMRQFTKTFWMALQYTQFDEGSHNTSNVGTIGWNDDAQYLEALQRLHRDDPFHGVARVTRATFNSKIYAINQMCYSREILPGKPAPKRRKTNESDDHTHTFWKINNSISLSNPPIPTTPSWRTLLPKQAQTTIAPSTEPPAFALRPKPASTGNVLQQINSCATDGFNENQEGTPARLNLTGPKVAPMGGVGEASDEQGIKSENYVPAQLTAPLPLNSTSATPIATDCASSFASRKFFNPFNGRYEGLNVPKEEERMRHIKLPPIAARTGNRVKQAFSNSNTDNEETTPPNYRYPINAESLLKDITASIEAICSGVLFPPHLFHQTGLLPTDLFDSLLCLNANEFRYLPLWVPDGNDDGTGGVFEEVPVPNLDPVRTNIESFGPGRIKRAFDQSDTEMSSEIDEITSSQAISTLGKASKLDTDGTQTLKSMSSIGTINVNRETAFTDMGDFEDVDHNVAHVVKEATGAGEEADTDMLNIDEFSDDDDDDDVDEGAFDEDSDSDGVNWDGARAKEPFSNSETFENSNQHRTGNGYDQGKGAHDAQPNLSDGSQNDINYNTIPDFETVPNAVDKDSGKGKAKAQNFPHGFVLPDVPSHNGLHDSPTQSEEFARHQQSQNRPRPHPRPDQDQASSSSSVVLIEMDDKNDNSDDVDNDDDDDGDDDDIDDIDDGFEII